MLKAKLSGSDTYAIGWEADKGPSYECPECSCPVVLKKGGVMVHHFAHLRDSSCQFGTGESMRHMRMKMNAGLWFKEYCRRVDFEVPLVRGRRADVVLYGCIDQAAEDIPSVVIECQASAISVDEMKARTRDYNAEQIPVVWLWDSKLLRVSGTLEGTISMVERRIPGYIRYNAKCRPAPHGVYGIDPTGDLRFMRFSRAAERYSDWDGSSYTPKTIRHLTPHRARDVQTQSHSDDIVSPRPAGQMVLDIDDGERTGFWHS